MLTVHVKLPVPEPTTLWELLIVGYRVVVLQHTPRSVTVAHPSEVTLPPVVTEVCVQEDMDLVVTVGKEAAVVVKLRCGP